MILFLLMLVITGIGYLSSVGIIVVSFWALNGMGIEVDFNVWYSGLLLFIISSFFIKKK